MSLIGAVSSTDEEEMEGLSFRAGGTDTFDVTVSTDIGQLECLQFRMDGSDGWRFETVNIIKVQMMKNYALIGS